MSDHQEVIPLPGKKRGGRPAGSLGYFGRSARLILEQAFEGMGGLESLITWGKKNPTEFYRIWAKLLPQNIAVPTTLDSARILLAQLEEELELPATELNIQPVFDAEVVDDDAGSNGPDQPDSPAG